MKTVIWPNTAETNFSAVLIDITEFLAVKSITVTIACIIVWLLCTLSEGMGTHMREWNLSLWMDPRFISINPTVKSMTNLVSRMMTQWMMYRLQRHNMTSPSRKTLWPIPSALRR